METLAGILIGLGLAGLGLLLKVKLQPQPKQAAPTSPPSEKSPEHIAAEAEEVTREPTPKPIRNDDDARRVLRKLVERAKRKRTRPTR